MHKFTPILLVACVTVSACSSDTRGLYQGYVEGEYVRVAAPFAGTLTALSVQRGVEVKTGAPLFILEQENERAARSEAENRLQRTEAQLANLKKGKRPSELEAVRAQRAQAVAALKLSQRSFQRDEKLAAQGFISKQKLDDARTQLESGRARIAELEAQLTTAGLAARSDEIRAAEADAAAARAVLKQADWKLAQKTVTAPLAGLIDDTFYTQGEWIPAGSPVVALLPPQNIKVRFFVAEPQLGALKLGQTITISCDACKNSVAGKVSFISSQAEYTPPVIYSKENRTKLVYLVEARTSPQQAMTLHPGQPVDIKL